MISCNYSSECAHTAASSANSISKIVYLFILELAFKRFISNILPSILNLNSMPLCSSLKCITCMTMAKKMLKKRQAAGQPCLRPCLTRKLLENFPLNLTLYLVSPWNCLIKDSILRGMPIEQRIFHSVSLSTESLPLRYPEKPNTMRLVFLCNVDARV